MIDFHLHSNNSDGLDSPQSLIDKAIAKGMNAIALTDHDNVDGIDDFLSNAENKKIIGIPVIQISNKHEHYKKIKKKKIIR
jgi:hypothetical protein